MIRTKTRYPMQPGRARRSAMLGRALTLIELLLVLVILTALAAIVVPKFTKRSEQAKLTAARTDISNIEVALDAYEVDCGHYPSPDEGGLEALIRQPSGVQAWQGPYLKKGLPKDPWGNLYTYHCPGQHNSSSYDLYSFGPDSQDGGGDDVDNWTSQ